MLQVSPPRESLGSCQHLTSGRPWELLASPLWLIHHHCPQLQLTRPFSAHLQGHICSRQWGDTITVLTATQPGDDLVVSDVGGR